MGLTADSCYDLAFLEQELSFTHAPMRSVGRFTFNEILRLGMGRKASAVGRIQALLADGRPRSSREIAHELGWGLGATSQALRRAWESGIVLRTADSIYAAEKQPSDKPDAASNLRSYHLYCVSKREGEVLISDRRFVGFSKSYLDPRGGGSRSKARAIREFLTSNRHRALYSTEIAQSLKDIGVKAGDVMSCVRRLEERGLAHVRGYEVKGRQTPFKEGYLITWLDLNKPKDKAIREAVERTDAALGGKTLKEQETEPVRQEETRRSKVSIGGPRNLGSMGNRFFLYIPPELTREGAFPFEPGTPLSLEVKPDCLIIRADDQEKIRVPFLPPNSATLWFKGTCNLSRNKSKA